MWIFVLLVIAVLCISLYDFSITKTWHKATYGVESGQSEKLRARHKRANVIRTTYNRIMLFTVGGMVTFIVLSLYTQTIVGNMYPSEVAKVPEYDTTQISLEAPPMEEIKTIENNYKLEGNSSREVAEQQEIKQREKPDRQEKEQNADSKPDAPAQDQAPKTKGAATDDIRAMEAQFKNTQSEMLQRSKEREEKRKQDKIEAERMRMDSKNSKANSKPATSKSGTADVEWNKSIRKAFQNNDDNVRTPKYTCPAGVSGKVEVRVKINSSGEVISATPLTSGVNECLMQQATTYARTRSRFEPSSKDVEELTLKYTFYP